MSNDLDRLMMRADMARKEARLNSMADPPPLSPYCEHCEGNGYVQCDYDETTPCTHCLDGREVAEQEARNA